MKEIFQGKTFWVILVILLLVLFVYPPWIEKELFAGKLYKGYRYWDWIFSNREWGIRHIIELDFKTILAESIIAILLSIGICLIPFKKIRFILAFRHQIKETPKQRGEQEVTDSHVNTLPAGHWRLFDFESVITNKYLKFALVILMMLLLILWIISKYHGSQRLKETEIKELKQGRKEKSLERMIEELRQITKQEQKTEGWTTIPKGKESDQK